MFIRWFVFTSGDVSILKDGVSVPSVLRLEKVLQCNVQYLASMCKKGSCKCVMVAIIRYHISRFMILLRAQVSFFRTCMRGTYIPWHLQQPHSAFHCPSSLHLSLRSTARSPKLSFILSTHSHPIPSPFPSLPKSTPSLLPYQYPMAESAIFRSIIPLPTTPSTDHAVRPFIRVFLRIIMALIT